MFFDTTQVLELVKIPLSSADKKKGDELRLAMGAALDELSMRLKSKSYIVSYSQTIAAAARQTTLRGKSDDLRYLFALKMGSGSEGRVLEYKDPDTFLRTYDASNAPAGSPNFFTIIKSEDGYPIVRYNVPLVGAEALVTYYYKDITPDGVSFARSIAAVAAGTQAYFFGLGSEQGDRAYSHFKELAALARSSDSFLAHEPTGVQLSRQDKTIRVEIKGLQLNRR